MELGADPVRVGDTHTCTVQGHKSASPVHACLFHSLAIGLDAYRLQLRVLSDDEPGISSSVGWFNGTGSPLSPLPRLAAGLPLARLAGLGLRGPNSDD